MRSKIYHHALNAGVVDANKQHRIDLERLRLAADTQTNLICISAGPAFLRPGTKHLNFTAGDGDKCHLIPFDAGDLQTYSLELTDSLMRVRRGIDFELVERPAVSTTVTSGDFSASTGWTLGTAAGTTVAVSGGALRLQAFGRGARAFARQQVTVAVGDQNEVHALGITIFKGPVRFRVGSSSGGQQYIKETVLRTGYHSIAFLPTGNFWIEFSHKGQQSVYVNDCQVEPAGVMELPTVWSEDDFPYIRFDQSLDVLFVACEGRKQQRIESRGDSSWSVVDYDTDDGPFLPARSADVRLKPSVLEGNGTLTADVPYFTEDHVGALVRLYHDGQKVDTYLAAENQFTPPIMVTGLNEPDYNERFFTYTVSGTWAGTLKWQRSFEGEDIDFHPFRREQASATINITANLSATNDDNDDNAIAYYRLGFEPGAYTSGAPRIQITYNGGGNYGICRIVGYVSSTVVNIEVLRPFMNTTYTDDWREGQWSEVNGWPLSVAIDDGRLNWAGYDAFWGSISDAYENFDEEFVGDAGPLSRSIGVGGGRNSAFWLMPLSQLMLGTSRQVVAVRASSLEETRTPENFSIRRQGSNVGAARVQPAMLADDHGLFVEANGAAIYELNYDGAKGRYPATEFSKLTTDLYSSGIIGMAVQDRPDQRIWVTLNSGDAVCIVFNPKEEVVAAIPVETGDDADAIESLCILPSSSEGQERVIMSIKRTVDGVTKRRIELLGLDTEAKPTAEGTAVKCLDAYVEFSAGSATVTGLDHLEGRTVRVWMDGKSLRNVDKSFREFTVTGGQITLPSVPVTGGVVGLPYVGRYRSAKIEYGAPGSTSMLNKKSVNGMGVLLADYCRAGVKTGTEFDNPDHPLRELPLVRGNKPVAVYDEIVVGPDIMEPIANTESELTLDARVCIEVQSPDPATILAIVLEFQGAD